MSPEATAWKPSMAEATFRDLDLALELEFEINAPRAAVWRCWTEPDLFKQWFCPKPWNVVEVEFDLRPGGRMNTVMQGPDGTRVDSKGVWLDVDERRRLTFSDAFNEGFMPNASAFMTSNVEFSDAPDNRTRMVWGARHSNEADKQKHLQMGFKDGWSAAAGQLEELAQSLAKSAAHSIEPIQFNSTVRTCLWFERKGLEAAEFYVSLLPGSAIENVLQHGQPDDPMIVEFNLGGAPMMILTAGPHHTLTPAVSIAVLMKDQAENDALWAKLLEKGGKESMCGWLTDRFGVSWQIAPKALPGLLAHPDAEAAARVQAAMMKMKKIDIAALEAAAISQ